MALKKSEQEWAEIKQYVEDGLKVGRSKQASMKEKGVSVGGYYAHFPTGQAKTKAIKTQAKPFVEFVPLGSSNGHGKVTVNLPQGVTLVCDPQALAEILQVVLSVMKENG